MAWQRGHGPCACYLHCVPGAVLDPGDAMTTWTKCLSSRSLHSGWGCGRACEDRMEHKWGRERAFMAREVRKGLSAWPPLFSYLNYEAPPPRRCSLHGQPARPVMGPEPTWHCFPGVLCLLAPKRPDQASRQRPQQKQPPSPASGDQSPPSPVCLARPPGAPCSCPSPIHLRCRPGPLTHYGH